MGNNGSSGNSNRKVLSLPNSPEVLRLPSPYNKQSTVIAAGSTSGSTSIPLPATVAATRRCPPDKVRPAPSLGHQTQLGSLKHGNGGIGSASSSRSTSPSQQQPPQNGLSFIPQPKSQNSVNRQPAATNPSPRTSTGRPIGFRAPPSSPYANPTPPVQQNKNSVLDKFKLFNSKDKNQDRSKQMSSGVSKRTSSSSGFSSARSEHSDSSTSLCDQSKAHVETPKSKALKSKLQAKASKQVSPKAARKEQVKAQSKIAKTKGTEKLIYSPSTEDVMTGNKATTIGSKFSAEKKVSNIDILKQPTQSLKTNSSLQILKQIPLETKVLPCAKIESKSMKTKIEISAKISDTKIHLLKTSINGINKDIFMQKDLVPNSDDVIKHPDYKELKEKEIFDKTLSMNQVNQSLSEEKANQTSKEKKNPSELFDSKSNEVDLIIDKHQFQDSIEYKSNSEYKAINPNGEMIEPFQIQISNNSLNKHVLNSHQVSNLASGINPGSSIPKPTALVKGTSKPPKDNNIPNIPTPTKYKSDMVQRKLDPNTIAMVSPMPSFSDLMSESSHSNSNSTGQSNSSDSSVIYRPSSESGSEIKTIPNRKIDTTFEQMEKVLSESSTCGGSMADDETEMTVKPMQPLLRAYTPGPRGLQTLPSKTTTRQYTILHTSSHHHVGHEYADIDTASGYLSDGEILRGGLNVGSETLSDLCDGYMSESGASLYTRRINPSYGHEHQRGLRPRSLPSLFMP